MKTSLAIHYEGYWQCRQATDPDPSRDPRGASGYTFAIGAENDLDQIIRLQMDEIPPQDFRPAWPPPSLPPSHPFSGGKKGEPTFGVFVSKVELGGTRWKPAEKLLVGGKVRWLPHGDPLKGPRLELRNTVIFHPGNNNGIFMPIVPFHIQVEGRDHPIRIGRDDPLVLDRPEEQIWEIADSMVYRRRCPTECYSDSDEALAAIGLTSTDDYLSYFQKRREWLEFERMRVRSELEVVRRQSDSETRVARLELELAALSNRLYVIQAFTADSVGNRLGRRLGMLVRWDHDLRGSRITLDHVAELGGSISTDHGEEWRVRFWMGSFDGDTMRGYLRGTLTVPFNPD